MPGLAEKTLWDYSRIIREFYSAIQEKVSHRCEYIFASPWWPFQDRKNLSSQQSLWKACLKATKSVCDIQNLNQWMSLSIQHISLCLWSPIQQCRYQVSASCFLQVCTERFAWTDEASFFAAANCRPAGQFFSAVALFCWGRGRRWDQKEDYVAFLE